jgi:uncharacterized phage-associated protein
VFLADNEAVTPYDARAVANSFLTLAERDGKKLDPMKIQKLVYFAHGWHLAIYGLPLIEDTVEAWRYGPVIPALYHEFKEFGSGPITRKAVVVEIGPGTTITFDHPEVKDSQTLQFLQSIWDTYGELTGVQLSNMTHAPGTPWEKAWSKHVDIGDEVIKQYFVAQLDAA